MSPEPKRIALLGFSIECNKFAPVTRRQDFTGRCFLAGEALVSDARAPAPRQLSEMPGFVAEMDHLGPWVPVPILTAQAEPGGPVDQAFFDEMLDTMRAGLAAAAPLDGVYVCEHGAALTTGDDDPDGAVFAMVREVVGPDVPVVATLDLHANVSRRMVDSLDVFIGYRTNPHLDLRERGIEAAQSLTELMAGTRTAKAMIRLPIVPPTITQLTAAGPYAEMIDLGQRRRSDAILNVSVMGGFAYGDTAKNGLTVVVTSRGDRRAAHDLAVEIAELGWANRARFRPALTSLEEAVRRARGNGPALAFADVADNPGGGGRGNTTYLLEAFYQAGVRDALLGVFNDAELAEEAHHLGVGARFHARFNRAETQEFSKPFEAPAEVVALHSGRVRGRRGIFAGQDLDLGPSAAVRVGGVTVVVISQRTQCADPVFFEMLGLDIAEARSVIVKSRGHFRGGFDEFFTAERIVEVDLPGLTSPMLTRFDWKSLPRPVIPLDDVPDWSPPAFAD